MDTTLRPKGCRYPPVPRLPGTPAPRGRTHLRWEEARGTQSCGARYRAQELARAAPPPSAGLGKDLRRRRRLGGAGVGALRSVSGPAMYLLATWCVRRACEMGADHAGW
ncbi:hypothetical protein P7K49_017881 [Saguinus oedipus]|uniref:Uncharacterized protein n=1 Tax=Saguinus oedipus TaxID=9490 RepID=A0ABQ9V4P7_SAGOE|nr:hypothetical protein P7K49_017881 [Saguinus oedipus]